MHVADLLRQNDGIFCWVHLFPSKLKYGSNLAGTQNALLRGNDLTEGAAHTNKLGASIF